MKPILIAQKMTEIDERFILGSMPPAPGTALPKPRRESAFARFASSGWGAAVISGVVALGVLTAIVLAGRTPPDLPPVTTDDPPPVSESTEGESETVTEPVTEDTVIDTPEEAEARKDELIAILDALDYKWNILADPSYYFDQYTPVKEFGVYSVPYMLDYIMEREGETEAEELKRLGVILHFAYHNLGITDTSGWHHPDPYSSDLFDNTKCLMDHLEEYRLRVNTDLMLRNEKAVAAQSTSESSKEFKEKVYSVLDGFNISTYSYEYYYLAPAYYFPATSYSQEAYDCISQYGIMSVPDILRYIMEHESYDDNDLKNHAFLLLSAYEMLGVKATYGSYEVYWICPDSITDMGRASFGHVYLLAQALLDHINEHGVRSLYTFTSKEEAIQSYHIIQYTLDNARFHWTIERNLSHYQDEATLITVFGKYAVPYILDYILSHEGQSLTPDEEMNLGVLLHCAYSMLGVETTAEWHMPAEPVASTTDPFPYARELVDHLSEYGLEAVQ